MNRILCLTSRNNLKKLKERSSTLFFPIHCFGCGREGFRLCADYLGSIRAIPMFLCVGCGRASPGGLTHERCRSLTPFSAMLSPYHYADPRVRGLIKEFKYRGAKDIEKHLAGLTASGVRSLAPLFPKNATACPCRSMLRARERAALSQAATIAAVAAQTLNLQISKPLSRVRRTEEQARLSSAERAENCRAPLSAQRRSLVIISSLPMTSSPSGATMRAAAEELKKAGAHQSGRLRPGTGQGDRLIS